MTSDAAGASGASGATSDDAGAAGEGVLSEKSVLEAWATLLIQAECSKDERCGFVASAAACAQAPFFYAGYAAFYGAADYYGNQAVDYRLGDDAAQAACLKAVVASSCSEPNPEICARVLIPRAPLAAGALCENANPYLPHHPCVDGFSCDIDSYCPTCVAPRAPVNVGEPCKYDNDCKAGFTCSNGGSGWAFTCHALAELGGACGSYTDCREGACVGNACTTLVLAPEGGACSDALPCTGIVCANNLCDYGRHGQHDPGLVCINGFCHRDPTAGFGQACARHGQPASTSCGDPYYCVFSAPDAEIGRCGIPGSQAPTPCSSGACPAGTLTDTHGSSDPIPDYCMCEPLESGDPCNSCPASCNPETHVCNAPDACAAL